jgi:outer membrane protein TolC
LLCGASICLPISANAKDLTLAECLASAEAKNLGVAGATLRTEAARSEAAASRAGYYPSISASLTFGKSQNTASPKDSWRDDSHVGAKINVPLFEGFRTRHEVGQAQSELQATEADGAQLKLKLRHDVTQAYFGTAIAQKELELAHQIVARKVEQKKLLELRFRAGTEPKWAVTQGEAEIESAQLDVQVAEAKLKGLHGELKTLTQISDFSAAQVLQLPSFKPVASPENLSSIVEKLPEVRAAVLRVAAKRESIGALRASGWPQVAAFAQTERQLSGGNDGTKGVGIQATYNLFDPGRHDKVRTQIALAGAIEADLVELRASRRDTLADAIRNYNLAVQRLESSRSALDASRERGKIVGEEYAAGIRQYIEWEQTERQLIEMERAIYQALREAVARMVAVQFASAGNLL